MRYFYVETLLRHTTPHHPTCFDALAIETCRVKECTTEDDALASKHVG
jgi:hypothetical protein